MNNLINERAGIYFTEYIDPDTRFTKPKNEGNGVYSQETDKEFSKKGWCKIFFSSEEGSEYFIALFVWGYFPFVYKDGEYQKISMEEFKKNVPNYSALEKVAKKEYITIWHKQADRHAKAKLMKEDTNYFPY